MASYSSFKKITTESIINNSLVTDDFADNSITNAKIVGSTIQTDNIANGAVSTNKLSGTLDISEKTVTYRALVNNDFANASISGNQLATDAIKDNLGFTPLNKAGDTYSSILTLLNNSTLAGPDTDTGVRINNQTVDFLINNTSKFSINSSGIPSESGKPGWQCSGRGGWYYANTYGGTGGWRELDNIGYNVSVRGGVVATNNCRMNVPVSGYYYAYLQGYWRNDTNNTAGYVHWNIGKDSSPSTSTTGRTPHTIYAYGVSNYYASGIMAGIITYMNAGQYLSPQPAFGGNHGRHHGDHLYWCGYLIG